jgi:hypothetical protein
MGRHRPDHRALACAQGQGRGCQRASDIGPGKSGIAQAPARSTNIAYVFISERRAPLSAAGYQRMVARAGVAAKFTFSIHSHMLRHACGFKFLSLNEHRGKTRRAASMRIIAAPAPVFLMGVSHSKPASIQSSM